MKSRGKTEKMKKANSKKGVSLWNWLFFSEVISNESNKFV